MFRIYVGNISFNTTEDGLRELFGQYGQVHSVAIITDRDTGRSRGFGFVEMSNEGEGRAAITALDGLDFDDRKLTVNEARPLRRAELSKATWHDDPTRRTGTTNRHDEPARRTGTATSGHRLDDTRSPRLDEDAIRVAGTRSAPDRRRDAACERARLRSHATLHGSGPPRDRRGAREARRALVVRASAHEPVQYLVGRASFFAREFEVDPSTMIPQPSTEDLVSAVIDWWRQHLTDDGWGPLVADVGTGSGCIAVSLALKDPRPRRRHRRGPRGSRPRPAQRRATGGRRPHHVRRGLVARAAARAPEWGFAGRFAAGVRLRLLEPALHLRPRVGGRPGRAIGAGVRSRERASRRSRRARLPPSAHRGGAALLRPGGLLALEIGFAQQEAVMELAAATGDLENARVLADHEGHPRVLLAERAVV